MFENIKSTYILKIIFSFIDNKTKLYLVKYSKRLQIKIDIDINYYKLFKSEYIIYESKEKSKIYNSYNDELIYKGEILKGKKNGKGKEFYKNGLIKYEGEYLNGKKWNVNIYDIEGNLKYTLKNGAGIIEEYNNDGYLIFNGEYLNGERKGKGREYNYFGRITFDGEYYNGKRWNGIGYNDKYDIVYELKNGNGYIKEYSAFGELKFEGEYLNGEKNGKGKEYKKFYRTNELIFEGEYINDKKNGIGKEYDGIDGKLIFEGKYLYNSRRKGKEYVKGKLEYEGEYLFNKKWNGKGFNENGEIIYELINGTGKVKEYSI